MDMLNELCSVMEKRFGKKILSSEEVMEYLGIEKTTLIEMVKKGSLVSLTDSIYQFSVRSVASMELGVHNDFTNHSDKVVAPIADPALQSSYSLTLDVSEEEFGMALAQHGEGSVYWYEKRKCYQAAFYLTLPSGAKQRKIVSGSTEYEVIGKMQAAKSGAEACSVVVVNTAPPVVPRVVRTYAEVTKEYMDFCKYKNSDVTYVGKESVLNNHILPHFGSMDITTIKVAEIQKFMQKVSRKTSGELYSQSQIDNTLTILKAVFNFAYNEEYISRVPMRGLEVPRGIPVDKDSKKFSEEELVAIFRASMESEKYLTVAVVALGTGMRSEEFLALKWEDVDFENKTISVNKAMIKVRDSDPKSGKKWKRQLGYTKTESSKRIIPVGDTVLKQLAEWKKSMEDSGVIAAAKAKGNEDFIFLDRSGKPQQYDHISLNYNLFLERRGLKELNVTFHKFRHSYATWAKSKGGDPMVIKTFMGHSLQEDITEDVYTSLTDEMADRTVTVINDFVSSIWDAAHELGAIKDPKGRNGKQIH